ncbi:MAG TPA: hypothetical protein VNR88_10870 [Hyphomicrobium sp.]|nr:hypothetical protein [Hyphomicrobium sp.]
MLRRLMVRRLLIAAAVSASTCAAHAEVWMVKTSHALGCRDRETLIALHANPEARKIDDAAPDGCTVLYSGERLLEEPEPGSGFNEYLKVEREDGSVLFVHNSAVVSDPGIGSVNDDR